MMNNTKLLTVQKVTRELDILRKGHLSEDYTQLKLTHDSQSIEITSLKTQLKEKNTIILHSRKTLGTNKI